MRSVIFLLVIIAVWGVFLLYFALDYYPVFRRVNQQVQNYKTCLKNSHFGVEKFNFSLGLSFNFFCIDIIFFSV